MGHILDRISLPGMNFNSFTPDVYYCIHRQPFLFVTSFDFSIDCAVDITETIKSNSIKRNRSTESVLGGKCVLSEGHVANLTIKSYLIVVALKKRQNGDESVVYNLRSVRGRVTWLYIGREEDKKPVGTDNWIGVQQPAVTRKNNGPIVLEFP